jgi:MFS family permease
MSYTDPGYGDARESFGPDHFAAPERRQSQQRHDGKRRLILALVGVVLLVIGYFIATSFLPRWWAHRVGAMSSGTFHWGILWGLFFGIVSTFLPLLVASTTFNRAMQWKTRGVVLVVALLLAAPNLMTLGIVLGGGKAAHAGERTLDTDAPGFRGATLAGAIIAVIAIVGVLVFLAKHRRQRHELQQLRVEEKLRRAQAA